MSVPPQHLPVTDQTRLQNLQNFVAGAPSDSQLSGKKNEDGSITLFLRLTTPAKDSDGKPVWNPGVSQGDNERAQQAVTRIVAQTAQRMNLPATLGSASQSAPKTLTPLAASSSPQEPRLQIASARRAVDGVTQAAQSSHSSATPTLRPTNIQTQFVKYITDIENSFLEPDGSALADLFQPKEDSENPTALIEQIVSLASQFQNKTIKASAFNQNITPFVITIGAKISSHLNQKLTQSERQCYIICEGTNLSASILSKLENINSKFKTLEKPIKDNISMRIINFALNFLENKVTPEHFDKKTKDILYLGTEEYRFLKNIGIGGEGAVDLYQ